MKLEFKTAKIELPEIGEDGARKKDPKKVDLTEGLAGFTQLGLSLQRKLREVLGDESARLVTTVPEEQTADRVVIPIETTASPEQIVAAIRGLGLEHVELIAA